MVKLPNMQLAQDIKPKKKICFVVTKGVWGGAQKYVYQLATNVSKKQVDVFVIVGSGKVLKNKLEEQNIRVCQINSLGRDISIIADIKSFVSIFKTIRKEKPNILHLNSPKASGLGALAGCILNLLGIGHPPWLGETGCDLRIIQTVHGWTFNEDYKMFKKVVVWFFSWITTMLCHKTIVIDEKDRKQAIKMPFCRRKIFLIKNGIEPISFKEKNFAKNELLSRVSLDTRSNNLLWIGTISELHKNKGLEYIIRAVAKIEIPFVFFIIGEGEERNNLENLINKLNLENKVFLVGFLDSANQYLKAFDIFTLTSIKEGLPYTILEAGQAGLPIIASAVGGIPDIIENNINGILVEKAKPEEIKKTIEFMINNPEERKLFGVKLQEKVEKEFSLEQMLERTIGVYKNPKT